MRRLRRKVEVGAVVRAIEHGPKAPAEHDRPVAGVAAHGGLLLPWSRQIGGGHGPHGNYLLLPARDNAGNPAVTGMWVSPRTSVTGVGTWVTLGITAVAWPGGRMCAAG